MSLLSSLLPKPKNIVADEEGEAVSPVKDEKSVAVVTETQKTSQTLAKNNNPEEWAKSTKNSMALVADVKVIPMQYDEKGEKKYEVLAQLGHGPDRQIQATFKDLLPKDISDEVAFTKPNQEEIDRQTAETKAAIDRILAKSTTGGAVKTATEANYVKFTPKEGGEMRIVKMFEAPVDPLDPPKFSHRKAPKPPRSPPAPVLHSPPRKVTAEEQRNWKIPPCISNWKNPKGYTIPLDKRLAADGRGLQEGKINTNFASFAESLYLAEKHAREEVEKRAIVEKKLAEAEKREKEDNLRMLAQKAREEKAAISAEISRQSNRDSRREEDFGVDEASSSSKFGPMRVHGAAASLSIKEREELRRQQAKEHERELRLSRMSEEQRAKYLERMQERDVSEKIALGLVKPGSVAGQGTAENIFDQRLFDQTQGLDQGFHDDEAYSVYDKPLFAGSSAHLIYRPTLNSSAATGELEEEVGEMEVGPTGVLKRAAKAFEGADRGAVRSGPVEFERDESVEADPFGLDKLLSEAKSSTKRSTDSGESERQRSRRS